MVYTFALVKHANIRYRESLCRLSRCELSAMLSALSLDCEIRTETAGGADFLSFESDPLTPAQLSFLSRHSSLAFMAEKQGDLLRPLDVSFSGYLTEDLPEVLKYKGKTAVPFTKLMLNMALSLSPFAFPLRPVTVLDPLCGKGTTCFCALENGFSAVGMDQDTKAVREAADYFERFLQFHQLKHRLVRRSETCGKESIPVSEFIFADTKENYQASDTRSLVLATGDTALTPALIRKRPAHLIVADLPYGIQHAPQNGRKPGSFAGMLERVLPAWRKSLLPGGIIALSFNTLTLPVHTVVRELEKADFTPVERDCCTHLRHEVEQAVVRDVVFAVNEPFRKEEDPE